MKKLTVSTAVAVLTETVSLLRAPKMQRMKRALVLMLFILAPPAAYAEPLDGLLVIGGGFFVSSAAITVDLDAAPGSVFVGPTSIYGGPASFLVSELLGAGTYTRTHNLTTGGAITRTGTIPDGKTGVYYVIEANGNEYQIFNAWDVSADGLDYEIHTIADNIVIGGTLDGKRLATSFSYPQSSLDITVNVVGGPDQECSETGGSTITANATVVEAGLDLVIDRIEWWLDGVHQGNGSSQSLFIPLGSASVEAIVYATDGVTSDSTVLTVSVSDTLKPSLAILFLDSGGNEVTTAQPGSYTIKLNASDMCDPNPVVNGSAKPVMDIFDGDIITIGSSTDVQLPTTAVEVTATAVDAAGFSTVAQKLLVIQ